MGNVYVSEWRSKAEGIIAKILKGAREKECSICEHELERPEDTLMMLWSTDGQDRIYLCASCIAELIRQHEAKL